MNPYKSTIVKATLKRKTYTVLEPVQTGTVKDPETGEIIPVYEDQEKTYKEENADLILDVPFRVYGQNIISMTKDITYQTHDYTYEDVVVIAKVDYRVEDHPKYPGVFPNEKAVAESFVGRIGEEWDSIKEAQDIKDHWTLKKEDALATYDEEGNKTKYNGADKDDLVPFAKWEGQEKEKEQGEI